jgi:peptide/nickel transport system substrate-binding protein
LKRDLVTIAQFVPFAGVFPNSAAEFNDVVFNNNVFEGLGRVVGGEVKPALATSWTNPDNSTWRFKLRNKVKFHNGDSFTAADVKYSIDEALKNNWPNAFNLGTVKSVTVVDDYTVDIKTTTPDPVLLNRLVFAFIVSEKQFKEKKKGEKSLRGCAKS